MIVDDILVIYLGLLLPGYGFIFYYIWKEVKMLNVADEIASKQIEEGIKSVDDKTKREYMERVWNMDKAEIFHELMRVHGESAKLLMQATEELARLRGLMPDEKIH
jgi:hypothetical protein